MTARPAIWSATRMKGLKAMFIMMNAARLGVGGQGLAQGEVAYQNAVAYAKDRRRAGR
jgi:alkylation response protein AidB-like acyl-CoA dehydrogenase